MYPHRIRLRGPWECEPLARAVSRPEGPVEWRSDNLPAVGRLHLPCRWDAGDLANFTGRVNFRRRFGYPGRIDPDERVWLTFTDTGGRTEVSLNDQPLGRHEGPGPFEFEVTPLLRSRNELVVEVETTTVPHGPWGEVALEVRRAE